jgi:hypothetical protein
VHKLIRGKIVQDTKATEELVGQRGLPIDEKGGEVAGVFSDVNEAITLTTGSISEIGEVTPTRQPRLLQQE